MGSQTRDPRPHIRHLKANLHRKHNDSKDYVERHPRFRSLTMSYAKRSKQHDLPETVMRSRGSDKEGGTPKTELIDGTYV